MTEDSRIERVVGYLENRGFRRLTDGLELVRLKFNFPAVLVNNETDSDLVIVVDTLVEEGKVIQERIEGVARALDIMGSKRSITAVFTGARPDAEVFDDLARVCRILPIGDAAGANFDSALETWLKVLTPITVAQLGSQISDSRALLRTASAEANNEILSELVAAEFEKAGDVTELIAEYFRKALSSVSVEY